MTINALVLCVLLWLISLSAFAQTELSVAQQQEDFKFLRQKLENEHLGLYWYQDTATVDRQMDSLYATLTEPQATPEFYKTISRMIALTNDGHTEASLPKMKTIKLGLRKAFLPVYLNFCDDGQAVVKQFYGDEPTVKRGMKLLAINGTPMDSILNAVLPYISTDGFNQTAKYEWIEHIFPMVYRLGFGTHRSFQLTVADPLSDAVSEVTVNAVRGTRFKDKHRMFKESGEKPYAFELWDQQTALFRHSYFSPSFFEETMGKEYQSFLDSAFTLLKKEGVKNLILDIRTNGGGAEGMENLLFSYLVAQPIQKYAYVEAPAAFANTGDYREEAEAIRQDGWEVDNTGRYRRGQHTLMSNYYSEFQDYRQPDTSQVFRGKVYVLIGGDVFSGGAEFASLLRMTDRAVFIGEETGGAYEGNVSGYFEHPKLPHAKIEIRFPYVKFRMNVDPTTPGHGVIPDYVVPTDCEDYGRGRDTQLEFTEKLIKEVG